MIQHLKEKYPRSVFGVTFIQLFLYFALGAHWTACIFFSIGYGIADPAGSEWQTAMYTNGWVYNNGLLDEDVPWQTAHKIMDKVTSTDVEVQFVKTGDHRLSEPHDIARLLRTVGALLEETA